MSKIRHTVFFLPLMLVCLAMADKWKELDLGSFKLSIPVNWNYKAMQGKDSFVGQIVGPKSTLEFDFSNDGYASHLISTEQELASYTFKIDTTDAFITKTIWPKVAGKGITGVYMQSRTSHLNFQMSGANLPLQEQQLALQAFRTIIIKYQ